MDSEYLSYFVITKRWGEKKKRGKWYIFSELSHRVLNCG